MLSKYFRSPRLRQGLQRTGLAVAYPLWTFASVFVIGSLLSGLIVGISLQQLSIEPSDTDAVYLTTASIVAYLIGLAIMLMEPYAIRRMTMRGILELLGLLRRPWLSDVGKALLAWSAYMIIMTLVTAIITTFISGVDLEQTQEIGFDRGGAGFDKFLAFIVVVIAAPVVEEMIFRGYLQGSLRRFAPWWLGAIITGALFGFVHGQLNVGIDTFFMSMIACYLREITGSIWSGVFLHAIKNGIAYYLLFWAPPWMLRLFGG